MRNTGKYPTQKAFITLVALWLVATAPALAQTAKKDTLRDVDRTFMPSIQLGYVNNVTDELSGGLVVQTLIEYRHWSKVVVRVNYDDFNTTMTVPFATSTNTNFTGRVSFTEVIGGVGYRDEDKDESLYAMVQAGYRFYGYPEFITDGTNVTLNYSNENVPVIRYTLGYDWEFAKNTFICLEALTTHTLQSKDFWDDSRWSWGITAGISTLLF